MVTVSGMSVGMLGKPGISATGHPEDREQLVKPSGSGVRRRRPLPARAFRFPVP